MEKEKEILLQNEYPVGCTPQAPAYPSETDHCPQSKRNGDYTMVAQHQMPRTHATISQQPGSYSQVAHAPGTQQLMPMPYTPSPLQPVPGPFPPIMIQPGATVPLGNPATFGWMPLPPAPEPDCPPGLEYLTTIDQLLVHQKVELLEGFETANQYSVKNILGQKVFYAGEQSDCCTRNCCGSIRDFGMKIVDNYQREVIHLERPLRCQSCCCPCCLQNSQGYGIAS